MVVWRRGPESNEAHPPVVMCGLQWQEGRGTPSVNEYLIQASAKQHEGVPKRAGDRTQIMYMHKASVPCARREHVVMQEQLGGF